MEPADRLQAASQSLTDSMPTQAMPQIIEPCATLLNEHGFKIPAEFHLLSCGHIVGIADVDQRCGCNCLHAATTIARLVEQNDTQPHSTVSSPVLAESTTQHSDILYCEICNGIPVDRYQRMNLEPEGRPSTIRRSLAIRRLMLHSFLDFSSQQTDEMFCFPYFCSTVDGCDGQQHAHKLRCGHLVWNPLARSCAANCADWESVQRATPVAWERQGDAILCHECEGRAAQVYRRFAQNGLGVRQLTTKDILS